MLALAQWQLSFGHQSPRAVHSATLFDPWVGGRADVSNRLTEQQVSGDRVATSTFAAAPGAERFRTLGQDQLALVDSTSFSPALLPARLQLQRGQHPLRLISSSKEHTPMTAGKAASASHRRVQQRRTCSRLSGRGLSTPMLPPIASGPSGWLTTSPRPLPSTLGSPRLVLSRSNGSEQPVDLRRRQAGSGVADAQLHAARRRWVHTRIHTRASGPVVLDGVGQAGSDYKVYCSRVSRLPIAPERDRFKRSSSNSQVIAFGSSASQTPSGVTHSSFSTSPLSPHMLR